MRTVKGWRNAYGALKDTTTVGLAKLNSKFKEVALKTLIVIHRTLREGDSLFRDELL